MNSARSSFRYWFAPVALVAIIVLALTARAQSLKEVNWSSDGQTTFRNDNADDVRVIWDEAVCYDAYGNNLGAVYPGREDIIGIGGTLTIHTGWRQQPVGSPAARDRDEIRSVTWASGTPPVANRSPSASISASSTSIKAGTESATITFSASDPDSNLKRWRFYKSDNSNPQWSSASGGSAGPGSYTYSSATTGSCTFIVEAEDAAGQSSSDSVTVSVYQPVTTYRLTVSAGSGGTAGSSAANLSGSANPGIWATPSSGYEFDYWSGDAVASSSSASTTVPMNNGDRSVTARFKAKPVSTYSLTVSAGTGGTAGSSATGLSGSATRSIWATPSSGYEFDYWSGDAVASSSSASTTVSMNNGDRSVTARFRSVSTPSNPPATTYSLTVTAGAGGSASGSTSGLAGNAAPSISATPYSGYEFDYWSGATVANSSSSSTTVPMNNGDRSVTAHFAVISTPPQTHNVSVNVSPAGAGSVIGGGNYSSGDTATMRATANSGYAFSYWGGDLSGASSPSSLTVNANKTVTAYFTTAPSGPDGSITATPPMTTTTQPVTVSWTTSGVAAANVSGTSLNSTALSGSQSLTLPAGTHTFTLTGYNGASAPAAPGNVQSGSYAVGQTYTFTVVGSTSGTIWGSSTYTADSSIAMAAVHRGLVLPGQTAVIDVKVKAGQSSYSSSTANGVTSTSYGSWDKSYTLSAGTQGVAFTRQATVTVNEPPSLSVDFSLPAETVQPRSGSTAVPIIFSAYSPSSQLTEYQWSAQTSSGQSLGSSSWTAFSTHQEQGDYVPSRYVEPYWSYDSDIDQTELNLPYAQWYTYDVVRPDGVVHCNTWMFWHYSNWELQRPGYWEPGYYPTIQVPDRLAGGTVVKAIAITPTTALGTCTVTFTARDSQGRTATLTKTMEVTPPALTPQVVTISPITQTIMAGQAVTFTASGGQTGYLWGDSASGTGGTQTVTFTAEGTFTVSVYSPANTIYARSNTATATVIVNPASFALTTYVAAGSGAVAPSGTNTYAVNANVAVTATPAVGQRFLQWVGDASGNANPLIVVMAGAKTVGATFVAKSDQTISFPNPGSVLLVRQPDGSYSATTMLTATASSGLPVTYAVTSGTGVSLFGPAVTGTVATSVTIQASQSGDAFFNAAPSVSVTFDFIYPATQDAAVLTTRESNDSAQQNGTGHFIDPKP